MLKFEKFKENPIMLLDKNVWWESGAVFNPCSILDDNGKVILLYRAIPANYEKKGRFFYGEYISYIGLAKSTDGVHFIKNPEPFISPSENYDLYGVEDPRIVKIKGISEYLITYTAINSSLAVPKNSLWGKCKFFLSQLKGLRNSNVRFALASTKDFKTVKKYGVIGPNHKDKDVVIFPELINEKIVILHRILPNIQIAYFNDFNHLKNPGKQYWKDYMKDLEKYTIIKPEFSWESKKIGAGPTPIKTNRGWLLIYHGVDSNHFYRVGAVLLDLFDPSKVIARVSHPLLEPTERFEIFGDTPRVTFPDGTVILNNDLYIYYGGGDGCIGGAKIDFKEFLDYLMEFQV